LALGDLLGSSQNALIVVTTEGNCYLFDVPYQNQIDTSSSKSNGELNFGHKETLTRTSSLGPLARKFPSAELKSKLPNTSNLNGDAQEERLAQPEPSQETSLPSSSRSLVWNSSRTDSAPSMSSGKYSEAGAPSGSMIGIPSTKPIVHDDWVSNAPSQIQPSSSVIPSSNMMGGVGGGGGPLTSHSSLSSIVPSVSFAPSSVAHQFHSNDEFAPGSSKKDIMSGFVEIESGSSSSIRDKTSLPLSGRLPTGIVDSTTNTNANTNGQMNSGPWGLSGMNRGGGGGGNGNVTGSGGSGVKTEKIDPVYRWFVAGNGTCCIIADIDEDKQSELVIGSSNRVVYSYGITHELDAFGAITTKMKLKNKWNVPGQVASLSLSRDRWGRPILVVAQHGGNYTTIDHRGNTKYRQVGVKEPVSHLNAKHERNSATQIRHLFRQPFSSSTGAPQDPVLMAMAGLDGTVKLQEESNSKVLWQRQLDHQFFALSAVDLTGDGINEIITCAWDGTTYIFDQKANCVEFQFEERVAAFAAGNYSITKGNQQPCLFFLTFSDHLYIYYNLPLTSIPISSLISEIGTEQFEHCRNTKIDKGGPWTRAEQARIIRSLLDPSKFDEEAALAYKIKLEQRLAELSAHGEA
jgi:hypothetical protein